MSHPIAAALLLGALALILVPACGDRPPRRGPTPEPGHRLLSDAGEVRLDPADRDALPESLADAFDSLDLALASKPALQALDVVQPDEGATLVGDDQPPRFLWRDAAEAADTWWISIRLGPQGRLDVRLLVLGGMPAEAALDPFSSTLHAWSPSPATWAYLVEHAADLPVVVTLVGFAADAPGAPLSRGSVTITVSKPR